MTKHRTNIFAHRGLTKRYPENTMGAFDSAIEIGVDGLELDARLTKDNELVIMHDDTVNRMTNHSGYIRDLAFSEIKEMSVLKKGKQTEGNEKIPSLREVVERYSHQDVILNIELKLFAWDRKDILEAIQPYLPLLEKDKLIFSSFDHVILKGLQNLDLNLNVAPISHGALINTDNYLQEHGFGALHFKYTTRTMEEVNKLKAKGYALRPYTINSAEVMKRFFIEQVDGIITDNVEKAMEIRDVKRKK